jgi:hypothetical protein
MMGPNDRAMVVHVDGMKLREMLEERAKAHDGRAAFYQDRVKRMKAFVKENAGPTGEDGEDADGTRGKVSNSSLISDAQSTMKDADKNARTHRGAAKICRFMAERTQPDNVFEGDGLSVLAYLIDVENPTAMPSFWRLVY